MTAPPTYCVIMSGKIKSGFKPDQVVPTFAQMFNLPPKRAASLFGKPSVLKRQLQAQAAKQYAAKLSLIGVEVVIKRDTGASAPQPARATTAAPEKIPKSQPLSARLLLAPVLVALLGGALWYMVAIKMNYEVGLLAWFIGGGIGLAAMLSGGRSHKAGAICSILLVISVLSGKYMAASVYQSEASEFVESNSAHQEIDFKLIYQEEMKDARDFSRIAHEDDQLRHFMAIRGYSKAFQASDITDAELAAFRKESGPRMNYLATNNPTFDEWRLYTLEKSVKDITPTDLVIGSFTPLNILFLVLGIVTAYIVASGIRLNPRHVFATDIKCMKSRLASRVPNALRSKLTRLRN